MRWGACVAVILLMVGCAHRAPEASGVDHYEDAVAAALVFDPPVIQNEPPLDLRREGRGQEAVLGYELSTTHFYVRIDDRQDDHGFSNYLRRAVSERTGVSYR